MAHGGRFRLALGLACGASLAFLVFLLARPVGDGSVKLTANLAQLLAPTLAAASCAWAAASGSGRTRRAWALLAASAGSWAVGQATWVWYEHLARRELPFPSLADVGYLLAIPLAAAAMLAFPGRAERAALQARSLLDGAVIASSLLYISWALVLGPVFRAGEGSAVEQAIALAYPAGDVVLATIVFVVREAAISILRAWLGRHGRSMPATSLGQWKTALQMLAILLYLLPLVTSLDPVRMGVLIAAVALTVWSGVDYLVRVRA